MSLTTVVLHHTCQLVPFPGVGALRTSPQLAFGVLPADMLRRVLRLAGTSVTGSPRFSILV